MKIQLPFGRRAAGLLSRRLTVFAAAAAVALAGLGAGTQPARADAEDILRFLAGAIVIGVIVNAIDDNQTPQYYGRSILPDSCLETIRVNGRNIQSYNARCLNRAGYDNLPWNCRYEFRVGGGHTRTGFVAECLYDAGYRRQGGGYQPDPWNNGYPPRISPPIGGPMNPPFGNPSYEPPRARLTQLPDQCRMHYRQQGDRIEGYWANCLRNSGYYNLPGSCRVTSTAGDAIYNAQCLWQSGYRR